jgi:glycosyltransferase involved in cell wall biosynthesis
MKVLIATTMTPFIWDEAKELALNLQKNLITSGHKAEILRIPFQWQPAIKIPQQMLMVRAFELSNVDRVIALNFPAYLIRHPKKTLWIVHQFRQAYDLFDLGQSNLLTEEKGYALRQLIKQADEQSLQESRRVFTISNLTHHRLEHYNDFNAKVLSPPINDPELFFPSQPKGYIFAGGRINSMKRQHLLIEAMALTSKSLKLVVTGHPDTKADGELLYKLVEKLDLKDRVHLDLRFLPRTEYANYVNHANAIAYIPFDDELGYVAMEAAAAGKPIMTATDSGGILALARDNQTGWVSDPNPASLAKSISVVGMNNQKDSALGMAARESWLDMGVNWPNTVRTLLS